MILLPLIRKQKPHIREAGGQLRAADVPWDAIYGVARNDVSWSYLLRRLCLCIPSCSPAGTQLDGGPRPPQAPRGQQAPPTHRQGPLAMLNFHFSVFSFPVKALSGTRTPPPLTGQTQRTKATASVCIGHFSRRPWGTGLAGCCDGANCPPPPNRPCSADLN